eukprot:11196399-Lingulodinium_polyedra.AAC.3
MAWAGAASSRCASPGRTRPAVSSLVCRSRGHRRSSPTLAPAVRRGGEQGQCKVVLPQVFGLHEAMAVLLWAFARATAKTPCNP